MAYNISYSRMGVCREEDKTGIPPGISRKPEVGS